MLREPGTGLGRVHVQVGDARRRERRERVHRRAERAQRREQLGGRGARRSWQTASTIANDLPRNGSGISGKRRELQQPPDRGDLVRRCRNPLAPGVQHLGGALEREEQHAGVRPAVDRQQLELERGHDAEAAAAAAQRPEQVGRRARRRRARCSPSAVTSSTAVTRFAARPCVRAVPADAAAERVADDARVRGRAVQRGKAVLGRERDDVAASMRAGADAGAARVGVELDRIERARSSAAACRRGRRGPRRRGRCAAPATRRPLRGREAHHARDVLRVDREGDQLAAAGRARG